MKNIFKNKKFLFIFFLFIFLSSALTIKAANKDLEQSYPVFFGNELTKDSTLADLIMYIFIFAITLSGIAVFISFLIAGVQWMTSAGNPPRMQAAKDRMTSSLFGLVLLFGSYLLLNQINPQLTSLASPGALLTGTNLPAINNSSLSGIDLNSIMGIMFLENDEENSPSYILTINGRNPDFAEPEYGTWNDEDGTHLNDSASIMAFGEAVDHAILCRQSGFIWCAYFGKEQSSVAYLNQFRTHCGSTTAECGGNPFSETWNNAVTSAIASQGPYGEPCQGATFFAGTNYNRDANGKINFPPLAAFYPNTNTDPPASYNVMCDTFPVYQYPGGPHTTGNARDSCVSSFSIEGNCKVQLFDNMTGNTCSGNASEEFTKSIPDLGPLGWDHRAQCAQISANN